MRRHWRSTLWRKIRRVKLPKSLSFHKFWSMLYKIFLAMCNQLVGPKSRSIEMVHLLVAAVDHMKDSDFFTATIVLSSTRPKPTEDDNDTCSKSLCFVC